MVITPYAITAFFVYTAITQTMDMSKAKKLAEQGYEIRNGELQERKASRPSKELEDNDTKTVIPFDELSEKYKQALEKSILRYLTRERDKKHTKAMHYPIDCVRKKLSSWSSLRFKGKSKKAQKLEPATTQQSSIEEDIPNGRTAQEREPATTQQSSIEEDIL